MRAFLKNPVPMKPATVPETPFARAKQEWDLRIGTNVAQARNWRLAFFSMAIFSSILAASLFSQVQSAKVIPVLVGIDRERGEPTVIGPASKSQYQIGALEIKYFLSQFIRFVRSIPLDPVIVKQNWLRAYSYLRRDAAGLLNEMTNSETESPLKKIGKVVVSIQPISVVQVPETNSYQVRWRETAYSSGGQKLDEYTMLGTFLVEIEPPKDEQTLQENPLGLFIRSFQWNREL